LIGLSNFVSARDANSPDRRKIDPREGCHAPEQVSISRAAAVLSGACRSITSFGIAGLNEVDARAALAGAQAWFQYLLTAIVTAILGAVGDRPIAEQRCDAALASDWWRQFSQGSARPPPAQKSRHTGSRPQGHGPTSAKALPSAPRSAKYRYFQPSANWEA